MIVRLEERDLYLGITGFREVDIGDTGEIKDLTSIVNKQDVTVQFFNAELVATWEHIYFAVLNAVIGFGSGCKISRNLAVETMLYASGQRQIRKAIGAVGVKKGRLDLAVVVFSCGQSSVEKSLLEIESQLGKRGDDSVLELSRDKVEKIRQVFGISETEMQAVTVDEPRQALVNLVIERMALLAASI